MSAAPGPRFPVLAVLGFVAAVHIIAYLGNGRLGSPQPSGWSPADAAAAPPLARFDAGWYRSIAERGYYWDAAAGIGNVAFFPLYPLLVKVVSLLGLPFFWAGLLLSHVFFLASVALLYRLELERAGPPAARSALQAMLAFPWAFFLLAPYSESLFLALALAAILFALRDKWALVAVLGLLAGFTRIFALALVPALLAIAWRPELSSRGAPRRPRLFAAAAALMPAVGSAGFFTWLALRFSDPFVFLNAQRRAWGREPGWSGLLRSLQEIPEHLRERGPLHLGSVLDLLVFLLLLASVVYDLRSRSLPAACYASTGLVLIATSGSLASCGRFAVVLYPVYELLSAVSRWRVGWRALLLVSSLLQAYLIVRFVNWLWVA